MVPPKSWYTHCSGGNLPPPGPQGRNRGTFVFVTFNGASPSPGLEWRWVNAATFVPYIGLYHSTEQVVFGTWRAADCRPYLPHVGWYRSTARVIFATVPAPRRGWSGDESSPLHLYRVLGHTIQPHRLLLPRGGRQGCRPY